MNRLKACPIVAEGTALGRRSNKIILPCKGNPENPSIPQISLIERRFILFKDSQILLLKSFLFMMFFLTKNILSDGFDV